MENQRDEQEVSQDFHNEQTEIVTSNMEESMDLTNEQSPNSSGIASISSVEVSNNNHDETVMTSENEDYGSSARSAGLGSHLRSLEPSTPINQNKNNMTKRTPGNSSAVTSSGSLKQTRINDFYTTPTDKSTNQQALDQPRHDGPRRNLNENAFVTTPSPLQNGANSAAQTGKGKKRTARSTSSSGPSRKKTNQRGTFNSPGNHVPSTSQQDNTLPPVDMDTSEEGTDQANQDEELISQRKNLVQYLSIHFLPVDQLKKRFSTDKDNNLSEEKLIDKIIEEVNNKRETGKNGYVKKDPQNQQDTLESAPEENTNANFGFSMAIFTQTIETPDDLLANFGVAQNNSFHNTVILFYRKNEIYALTTRQTWQAFQVYCCYKFPSKISCRLTSEEGSCEEQSYHITGNVQTSKNTHRIPTKLQKLESIRLNVVKPLKHNCSLNRLKEFDFPLERAKRGQDAKSQIKMRIGQAYVRIKRRMDPKNIPEILDHFSKICDGQETLTFPGNQVEEDIDDLPFIIPVSTEKCQRIEQGVFKLIQDFMHHQNMDEIGKLDIVDKLVGDYYLAEDFKLTCNNGITTEFKCPPSALQVFSAIRRNCANDLESNRAKDPFKYFCNQIKKIRLSYSIRGGKYTERPLIQFLDGEKTFEDDDYWKFMGRWWCLRDEYYSELHKQFMGLLNKDGMLLDNSLPSNRILPISWNKAEVNSVQDYVKLYENVFAYDDDLSYFFPPNLDQDGTSTDQIQEKFYFDMFGILTGNNESRSIYAFYIYDRFDAGIRFASTRIIKSLEMLFKNTKISVDMFSKFRDANISRNDEFEEIFGGCDSFYDFQKAGNKVTVVVTFATSGQQQACGQTQSSNYQQRSLSELGTYSVGEDDGIQRTLLRERNRICHFTQETLGIEFNRYLSPSCAKKMWEDIQNSSDGGSNEPNLDELAKTILNMLIENDYGTKVPNFDNDLLKAEVTGKFLKLRNFKKFQLFEDNCLNKELFKLLKRIYITGFPGFIHKLECLQIYENTVNTTNLQVCFTDI